MFTGKIYITQDLDTGLTIRIDEITGDYTDTNNGYGFPNPYIYDVTKMRFLFSSYLSETFISTAVSQCKAGVQYVVSGSGSNTVVVDTKTFVLGDTFILEVDATPVIGSGLSLNTTGIFAMQTDFLPGEEWLLVIPSQMGVDSLIYPDSVYHTVAQYFTTEYTQGQSLSAGTYIVKGDAGNVINVSGVSYNPGETFTLTGTDTFSDTTGTSSVCLYVTSATDNTPLTYWSYKYKTVLQQKYASNSCGCNEKYALAIEEINNLLDAIEYNYQDDLNNDDSGTQIIIDKIAQIGTTEIIC